MKINLKQLKRTISLLIVSIFLMNIWVGPAYADGLHDGDAVSTVQSGYEDEFTPLNVSSGDISGTEIYF